MYTLKIERDNGYRYHDLPKDFSFFSCLKDSQFKSFNTPIIICKDDKVRNFSVEIDDGTQMGKGAFGETHLDGNVNSDGKFDIEKRQTYTFFEGVYSFKHIQYEENEKTINIIFNGRAYLIKENGKTIEKF